jgi:hypothetical protein
MLNALNIVVRGRVFVIAICGGLDDSGFESEWGAIFPTEPDWSRVPTNVPCYNVYRESIPSLRLRSIDDLPVSPVTWLCICHCRNCLQHLSHVQSQLNSLSHLAHNLLTSGLSKRRNCSAKLIHQFRPC